MKLYTRLVFLLTVLLLFGGLWTLLHDTPPVPSNSIASANKSESLLTLAHKLQIESQLDEAEDIYNGILSSSDPNIEVRDSIRAQIGIVQIAIERGKYPEALEEISELLSGDKIENHQLLLSKTLCTKAEAEIRYGDYVQADVSINECQEAYSDSRVGTLELEAYAEHLRGFLYQVQGLYPIALDHLQNAIELKKRAYGVESLEFANTLNNIANVNHQIGNNHDSIKQHFKILNIRESILPSGHPKMAATYGNLGNAFHDNGEYSKALQYHQASLVIWNSHFGMGHIESAFTLNNIGISFFFLNDLSRAESSFNEALDIKVASLGNFHLSTNSTRLWLSQVLEQMHSFEKAKSFVDSAITALDVANLTSHPKYWEAKAQSARLLAKSGAHQLAIVRLKTVVQHCNISCRFLLPRLFNDLAKVQIENKSTQAALTSVRNAIEANMLRPSARNTTYNPTIGAERNTPELLKSLLLKAQLLRATTSDVSKVAGLNRSLETYERALEIAVYSRRLKVAPESKTDLDQDINDIAEGAISSALELFQLTNDGRLLNRIFRVVEFQKSGHFFDDLTDAQAKEVAHVPDSLKNQEIELRNELASHDRQLAQLSASVENEDAAATIRHNRFLKRKKLDDLVSYTERVYPKYYSLKHGGIYSSIEDVITHIMKPNQILIQYFESDGQVYAIALNSKSSKIYHLSNRIYIDKLITQFTSLSPGLFDQVYFDILHELHSVLISIITSELEGSSLLIIPNELMNQVPFDALLTKPVDVSISPGLFAQEFPFLLKTFAINTGYSATLLLEQSKLVLPQFETQLLALGPVFDSGNSYSPAVISFLKSITITSSSRSLTLSPLLGSLSELTEIEKIVNSSVPLWKRLWDDQTEIRLRDDVSEHDLKNRDLLGYRYLHFATHSFADQVNPVNSGILLHTNERSIEDGILHASEIFGLKIAAELVVLSSCETALDVEGGSFGISGFAKGFIYAGAKNIIASLWPTDDTATMLLMREFYFNLGSNQPIDVALRNAKLLLMTAEGPISHPYYWSGFIHIGSSPESL